MKTRLRVLTAVRLDRAGTRRIISYRPASEQESEVYCDWLENECDEP